MSPRRPFNPDALTPYAFPWLVPNVSNWSTVWRYTVLLPVEQAGAANAYRYPFF